MKLERLENGFDNDGKVFITHGYINDLGVASIKCDLAEMRDKKQVENSVETYMEFIIDLSDKDCMIKDMKVYNPIVSMFNIDTIQIILIEISKKLVFAFNNKNYYEEMSVVNVLDPIRSNLNNVVTDTMNSAYKSFCDEENINSLLNIIEN